MFICQCLKPVFVFLFFFVYDLFVVVILFKLHIYLVFLTILMDKKPFYIKTTLHFHHCLDVDAEYQISRWTY